MVSAASDQRGLIKPEGPMRRIVRYHRDLRGQDDERECIACLRSSAFLMLRGRREKSPQIYSYMINTI